MLLLLLPVALAADLALSGGVQGRFGAEDTAGEGGLGHEVVLSARAGERWMLELRSTSAASQPDAHFTAMLGPRLYLSEPWTGAAALSAWADVGLELFGPGPAGALGLSVDLPARRRLTPRVSAGWELSRADADLRGGATLSLSLLVPPPPATPTPAVVEAPPPPPPPKPREPLDLELVPAEAEVWVPHPVCAWVPASQAELLLAGLDEPLSPEATLELVAAGYVPEHVHAEGKQEVSLEPAEDRGALLVLAHPGDTVRVGGVALPVDGRGLALMQAPEGRVTVEVLAGGVRQEYKAALANGYAVWIRAKAPPPTQILFAQGVSELSASNLERIRQIATNAAGWSFVLQGAYSYEGSLNVNNRLARERGLNVGAALLAAGVPADRIAYLDPPPADPNKDPATQRACNILAVPPERTP